MLKIKNISLDYTDVKVVKNISFQLKKGERLVIVGASGCGKTTLLKAIGGFHPISKGVIEFNEKAIIDPYNQLVPGHEHIKLVNQDFNLDVFHTVEENIRLRLLQFDKKYLEERVEELLKLTELTKYKSFKAKNLSGGQKQRLAIARALADEPELLLLDEPFNQLDYHLRHKIEKYILAYLYKNNISSILVSHNGEEAMRWANQIAFMKRGKLERIDTAENFYNLPSNKYEAGFFGTLNTVLINRKEVSFRPHQFSKKETKSNTQIVNIEFSSKINKGWYTDYQFSIGKRFISLYSEKNISDLTEIWVNPVVFCK
jgi:iron(III) transport system ATP-binding protein